MLIPTFRRTWGPQGQTPIVRYNYRHDRISAIAAITVASKRARMGPYYYCVRKHQPEPGERPHARQGSC